MTTPGTPGSYRAAMNRILCFASRPIVRERYGQILRALLTYGSLYHRELHERVPGSQIPLDARLRDLAIAGIIRKTVGHRRRGRPWVSYDLEDPHHLWEELHPLFPDLPEPRPPVPDDPGWEPPGFPR